MKVKWVVLLLVVLGVLLFGAVMSEEGGISAEPQRALQSPDFQIVPEVTGPPPPPGCRIIVSTVEPPEGGTIDVDPPNCGAEWYVNGSAVTLTAVPAPGYEFDSWEVSPPVSGTAGPVLDLIMDDNYFVAANFVPITPPPGCRVLQTTTNPGDGGTIDVDPEPNCSATWYIEGTNVTLTAVPNSGYNFSFWNVVPSPSPPISDTNPVITFDMDDNYTATANFTPDNCHLINTPSSPPSGGTVDIQTPQNCPDNMGWLTGTGVIMEAIPNVGFTFGHWEVSDPQYAAYHGSTVNPLIIQNGDLVSDVTLTAVFHSWPNCYDIVWQTNPPGEGSVSFNPPRGTDCPGGWVNGNVTITAVPDNPAVFEFDSWSGDINSTNNPETLTIDGNKSLTANFNQTGNVADLYIQKWDTADPVYVGQKLTYALVVGNNGPDIAFNVQVQDVLPLSTTYFGVYGQADFCNVVNNVLTCTAPGLAPGGHVPIFVVVIPNSPGVITNTATVSNTNPADLDNDLLNNTAVETTLVLDRPIAGLSAGNDSPTALGMTTTLTASVTGGTNVSYTWDFGDGTIGSGSNTGHTYGAPGLYTATVTATNTANTMTATTAVLIEEAISGLIVNNDSPTTLGMTTTLTATISAGTNVSYTWDFGDGSSGSGMVVTHVYTAVGTYTATVTATNAVGTQVVTTTVIVVSPVYTIYFPAVVGKPQ